MGCFGAPMTAANKTKYCNNHKYNRQADRTAMIKAASADTFGFDCVCLIKGLLWGWNGNKDKTYGGAEYACDGVPDIDADQMIKVCSNVSSDFSKIEVGEAVWMEGHIGVYVGDGLAVECTPRWGNCAQVTACNRNVSSYNRRNWTKHGKLPYVSYEEATDQQTTENAEPVKPESAKKTVDELAQEVIAGKWGNGTDREQRLTAAGYDYKAVQTRVNAILGAKKSADLEKVAKAVIRGDYGNGAARKKALTAAGYNYAEVQAMVNKMLKK